MELPRVVVEFEKSGMSDTIFDPCISLEEWCFAQFEDLFDF